MRSRFRVQGLEVAVVSVSRHNHPNPSKSHQPQFRVKFLPRYKGHASLGEPNPNLLSTPSYWRTLETFLLPTRVGVCNDTPTKLISARVREFTLMLFSSFVCSSRICLPTGQQRQQRADVLGPSHPGFRTSSDIFRFALGTVCTGGPCRCCLRVPALSAAVDTPACKL